MKYLVSLIILFLICFSLPLLWANSHFCFPYYDLGIYSEALRLITWQDLNPWIPGRFINIFNDHFDPIIIPFSFFTSYFSPSSVAIWVETFFALALLIPFYILYKGKRISFFTMTYSLIYLLFNKALIEALYFPSHPTTWAIFPLSLFFILFLLNSKDLYLFLSLTFLFCFKEEFPFVGIMLAFIYLLKKKWKHSFFYLFYTLLWLIFIFKLRPYFFGGATYGHGASLLGEKVLFHSGMFKTFFYLLFPLLPLIYFNYKEDHRFKVNWEILLLSSSILSIRFLSAKWNYHYGPVLASVFLFTFLPLDIPRSHEPSSSKRPFILFLLIMISLSFWPIFKKYWSLAGFHGTYGISDQKFRICPAIPKRIDSLNQAKKTILAHQNKIILAEGNLIAPLLESKNIFYQFAGSFKDKEIYYDMILLEKPPYGDPYPSDHKAVSKVIELWRQSPLTKIIIDDDFIFFAEGHLSIDR